MARPAPAFPPRRCRRGFTVAEVAMATALLGIAFVGFVDAVTIGSETLDTSRKQQVAAQIVSGEVDRLRSGPWSTIANLPSSATISIGLTGAISGDTTDFALSNFTTATGDDNTALSSLAPGFTVSLAATRLRPSSATASTVTFVQVAYTVGWTSNTGRAYSRTFETFFGQNGLHLSYQKS